MNVEVILTAPVVIGGTAYGSGMRVHLPEAEAKDLIEKNKARLAPAEVTPVVTKKTPPASKRRKGKK